MNSILRASIPVLVVAASIAAAGSKIAAGPVRADWNPKAAAAYLDGRAAWWVTWPTAARDHGTVCVSCHTTLPYALARPSLRTELGERGPAAPELRIQESVVRRVTGWNEMAPFYPDQTRGLPKTSESRGTEAVMNALVLATRDREKGHLSDEARAAFDHLWVLQMKTGELSGAWAWLTFHNEPWEAGPSSAYLGGTLAAMAVGSAPDGYAAAPEIQDNIKALRTFLQRDSASLFNRLMLMWASEALPGLMSNAQRQAIVDEAFARQQDDGGWTLASLGSWKRADGTPLDATSDGCATGLATLALRRAGVPASEPRVARGLAWLRQHQDPATGRWTASSLNKQRDPATDAGKFMSDAATAFAVLALSYDR